MDKKFYGQFETDKIISEYFSEQTHGNCIEIGAVDGKFISNTLYFEQIGWNVLCIEPIPEYFENLKLNRKNCLNLAVSDENVDNVPFTIVTMNNNNKSSISGLKIDNRLIESHNSYGLEPKSDTIYVIRSEI
jgi:polygalacturonase